MTQSFDPQDDNQVTSQGSAGGTTTGDDGAQPQSDLGGIMEENVDIGSLVANAGNSQQQQDFISSAVIPPHPNTKFDEKKFIMLLAGSISLTITEKKRIIEAIPKLSQFQIDELMNIFEEEKGKFAELEEKHAEQVKQLEEQHKTSWQDLESKAQEDKKKEDEARQAEEIKRSLGL